MTSTRGMRTSLSKPAAHDHRVDISHMSDFDLVSGFIDALVYVVFIAVGVALFLAGRRRGQETGGPFMKGLGVVLILMFGLAAIPSVVEFARTVDTSTPGSAPAGRTPQDPRQKAPPVGGAGQRGCAAVAPWRSRRSVGPTTRSRTRAPPAPPEAGRPHVPSLPLGEADR